MFRVIIKPFLHQGALASLLLFHNVAGLLFFLHELFVDFFQLRLRCVELGFRAGIRGLCVGFRVRV